MSDGPDGGEAGLNRLAVAGLVASVLVAVVGVFLVPWLEGRLLSFWGTFWALSVVEFGAAVGLVVSVLNLHD